MARVAAAVLLCAGAAVAVARLSVEQSTFAQAAPTMVGRVVADDTDAPIVNARVSISTTAPSAPVVLSDRDGRFTIIRPMPGYTVSAVKTGYARRVASARSNRMKTGSSSRADELGRFEFEGLPRGRYRVGAVKAGYASPGGPSCRSRFSAAASRSTSATTRRKSASTSRSRGWGP